MVERALLRAFCRGKRAAQRSGVIAVIPLLAWSSHPFRTTAASACGRGFPSLSKEAIFSAEFRDRD